MDKIQDLAVSLLREDKYSEAQYYFKWICQTEPTFENWFYRGLCFKFMEMFESALYCFRKALTCSEKTRQEKVDYHMAYCFYFLGDHNKASTCIARSLESENYWLSLLLNTLNELYLGNREKFMESFDKFLNLTIDETRRDNIHYFIAAK